MGQSLQPTCSSGLGFRSLNTGSSRVTGWETSVMGRATWGQTTLDLLAGYTYTNPISLTPDYYYDAVTNAAGDTVGGASYNSTSLDTTGQVLKYRSKHLFRFDAELRQPKWFLGLSLRHQSALQNIDAAWLEFERLGETDWGLEQWLEDHTRFNFRTNRREMSLPWIVDLRAGVNLTEQHKLSVVISNLTNAEYAIRPLAIEAPRLVNVVYTYELN